MGSWTALKTAIDGGFSGTITLAANFNCDYNSRIVMVDGQDVTIHANGAVCNAQQGGRFFNVNNGATLTLNGMTLKNGYSDENVSVFTLCFSGWPFVTLLQHTPSCNTPLPSTSLCNTAANTSATPCGKLNCNKGGAIQNYGTLNINGCTFEGNTAGSVSVNL
jgi:hypothetical protein